MLCRRLTGKHASLQPVKFPYSLHAPLQSPIVSVVHPLELMRNSSNSCVQLQLLQKGML